MTRRQGVSVSLSTPKPMTRYRMRLLLLMGGGNALASSAEWLASIENRTPEQQAQLELIREVLGVENVQAVTE